MTYRLSTCHRLTNWSGNVEFVWWEMNPCWNKYLDSLADDIDPTCHLKEKYNAIFHESNIDNPISYLLFETAESLFEFQLEWS